MCCLYLLVKFIDEFYTYAEKFNRDPIQKR